MQKYPPRTSFGQPITRHFYGNVPSFGIFSAFLLSGNIFKRNLTHMVSQNPWIMHSSKCLVVGCSSSSGLEGAVLDTVQPASALPFLWMKLSSLVLAPALELGRLGYGVPLVIASQKYHSHHRMRDALLRFRQLSQMGWQMVVVEWQRRSRLGVLPQVGQRRSWLLSWRTCSGAASSDWAGGGDNGVLGAEPNGES
ncbi:hypothetical protein V6N13_072098 [Hibiscus sabdariffa]